MDDNSQLDNHINANGHIDNHIQAIRKGLIIHPTSNKVAKIKNSKIPLAKVLLLIGK